VEHEYQRRKALDAEIVELIALLPADVVERIIREVENSRLT
jgi:hypothetical protein